MGQLHPVLANTHVIQNTFQAWQQPQSDQAKRVEQRVIKQLLQALIFEEIIAADHDGENFIVQVQDRQQQAVQYIAKGQRQYSYKLVRLARDQDVLRQDAEGNLQPARLNQVIDEILRSIADATKVEDFIFELKRTYIHDLQSQVCFENYALPAIQYPYDILESYLMDGHPYHPCYKSRVGFSLQDNVRYGVEFAQPMALVWLAVHQKLVAENHSSHIETEAFFKEQLNAQDLIQFQQQLDKQTQNAAEYVWIPVHPWQWENHLISIFAEEIADQDIIYLGHSQDRYLAQQSLRTVTNLQHPEKPYIKLSMSLTNTSSSRVLAKHTVMNGPIITDWLQRLIDQSETARQLDFAVLREVYGLSVDFTRLPASHAQQAYGTIGCLWRESVHQYLREGEDAIPLNGVSHIQKDGQAMIAPWLQHYGVEQWTRQLLKVVITPLIHLLFAEGIATESHGQNIILVHQQGWPTRILLKDFHDGVRYSPAHLAHPELAPELDQLPPEHAKTNSMSFILTDDLDGIRDFSCACLFFVALTDIAIFLNQTYSVAEQDFWQWAAEVIQDYQQQHPEHHQRYQIFDVFAEKLRIESLTKRRLFGDGRIQIKFVDNPLAPFKAQGK
ncbi:putative siderophore S biosynthesis protein, AcsC [Acinetobacter sp. neg1]|uniref:IucA/IucC family protein n=1 Tax=Acinetobacter TaxID=469 RepID=UPI000541F43B|nr:MULTISPECIES: IucA/IucC family protein [Acinetobacter]KHF77767.1 putative siderophore S biosynthesis protein, AcsC [Acinetobacter sp. neg1]KYQ83429.1 siderophore achromobactin biosynthesis protein AcsC [Acinetobacter sp. NRRL B-65365]MBJ8481896.1 siderophore achromobactin biosynthesis protein AcsC [Acinetobacter vivianii]